MKNAAKTLLFALTLVCTMFLIYVVYPAISRRYLLRPVDNTAFQSDHWHGRPEETVLARYEEILADYHRLLTAIPRHTFKPSELFRETGPPLSSVLKNRASKGSDSGLKRILAWTPFFGAADWIPKTMCDGTKKCVSTSDKNDLEISDGIVVHPRDLSDLPPVRLPHQRLIYLIQESPWATGIDVSGYNGVFNWTVTYRLDSDIPFPFFVTTAKDKLMPEAEFNQTMQTILQSKTKIIAYMNSNCHASHTKRLEFLYDLKAYLNVDVYGACGNLECPRQSDVCTKTMSQYKFYLSMENSHCRDYLTEKVTEPLLQWNAVPVVMGGADPSDYEKILPPNSYIHTSGFNSARDLFEYLILLDKNPSLYAKYHYWRRTHVGNAESSWCNLCLALHNASLPVQTYSDFSDWYRQDTCVP
ncbi:alpha-(1,3)-fucosyltransferase C-like [Liolophura sinensis]|uniref:alpha-(1,3)-fucosyltransferase C-like n=1 Tax=Liolophura sinensis TaxID=3198878 RepID=UPI0031598CA3